MQPDSQVITRRGPTALRGAALRDALGELGFVAASSAGELIELPTTPAIVEVDLGPPPSSAPPRAMSGDELQRVLEALRET